MASRRQDSVIAQQNFILATRESGYRSTAAAIAELVDNALQAGARTIHIWVMQHGNNLERQLAVAILDDGCGMDADTLCAALQFGGTERFNNRSGQGRFGMGLPNSSVSQCRRVDVFTWQHGTAPIHTYLDVDDVHSGVMRRIPLPRHKTLPSTVQSFANSSGTLVLWSRCDRLDNRTASTIARKLHSPLGRIFRYFLWDGVKILINGEMVTPIDPLFYHSATLLRGSQEIFSPFHYQLYIPGNPNQTASVQVRFTLLPVQEWHHWPSERKRHFGIAGGAGVSVIRAQREIAYGWYFMRKRRKQNYDDWWRCEISYSPQLDEWFGVTHSKQEINPTPELLNILGPDIEAVANHLNARVRDEFAHIRATEEIPSVRRATLHDWTLPPIPALLHPSVHTPTLLKGMAQDISTRYRLVVVSRPIPDFFSWKLDGNMLVLELNANHPFFDQVYQRLKTSNYEAAAHAVESLLLAFARAEAQNSGTLDGERIGQLRREWSNILAAFLI